MTEGDWGGRGEVDKTRKKTVGFYVNPQIAPLINPGQQAKNGQGMRNPTPASLTWCVGYARLLAFWGVSPVAWRGWMVNWPEMGTAVAKSQGPR